MTRDEISDNIIFNCIHFRSTGTRAIGSCIIPTSEDKVYVSTNLRFILLFVFYMINRQEKYAATTVSCWTPTLQYFEE